MHRGARGQRLSWLKRPTRQLLCAAAIAGLAGCGTSEPFDLVLAGGRVIDPASGLDATRNVGIRRGRIEAVEQGPLSGRVVVDVRGLVVAPGFIDLHSHSQDPASDSLRAMDGVTTALELEAGVHPVADWYRRRGEAALINYGASVSHGRVRAIVTGDSTALGRARELLPAEWQDMERRVRVGLDEGALGIGYLLQNTPGARREEVYRLFQVAAEHRAPNFVHLRFMGLTEPGSSLEGLQEVLASALATGAPLHVVHIGSSGLRHAPLLVEQIVGARRHGLDVTTEIYPYTAGQTNIRAALFDSGWQSRDGIDYGDVEWVATGERLTATTFAKYRAQGGAVIDYIVPQEVVDAMVAHPAVMIASDAIPLTDGRGHPRGAGTFSRVLGYYVREKRALTVTAALAKMTIMPARRLEATVPDMAERGRIRVGSVADITVFDPEQISDRATYQKPARPSTGIRHVLVAGAFVVRDGRLAEGVRPGRPIRRPPARPEPGPNASRERPHR